jgi:hypothetical protein
LGVAKAIALTVPHGPKEKVKTKLTSTAIQDILETVFISLPPFLISMDYRKDSSTSRIVPEFHPSRQASGAATFLNRKLDFPKKRFLVSTYEVGEGWSEKRQKSLKADEGLLAGVKQNLRNPLFIIRSRRL